MEILVYTLMTFFICAFVGYILEVLWVFIGTKKLVNRGFLCGPIIPIYGVGALLIIFSLLRYYDDPVVVFVFGIIITSALEYFTSFMLEKIFHNKWWDYSRERYNLNGRICLKNSFAFGILALVIIYFVTPLLYTVFNFFSYKVWCILAIIFSIVFIFDVIYSIIIAYNLRNRIIIVEELKNEKLAQIPILLDKSIRSSLDRFRAFPSRLLKAFPDLERNYHRFFEAMKKYRIEEKEKRKKLKKRK